MRRENVNKLFSIIAIAASLLMTTTAWPRSASTTVLVAARVEKFAEWAQDNNILVEADFSGAINNVGQERVAAKSIVLYTNADTLISAKPGLNAGVLTCGEATLKTAYKLTGALENPDASFKDASQFLSAANTYNVRHIPGVGSYALRLEVQAGSPNNGAPDEGVYTCSVVLTATW
jgi:hypothetical protein